MSITHPVSRLSAVNRMNHKEEVEKKHCGYSFLFHATAASPLHFKIQETYQEVEKLKYLYFKIKF